MRHSITPVLGRENMSQIRRTVFCSTVNLWAYNWQFARFSCLKWVVFPTQSSKTLIRWYKKDPFQRLDKCEEGTLLYLTDSGFNEPSPCTWKRNSLNRLENERIVSNLSWHILNIYNILSSNPLLACYNVSNVGNDLFKVAYRLNHLLTCYHRFQKRASAVNASARRLSEYLHWKIENGTQG
jgi:hypothetical protein